MKQWYARLLLTLLILTFAVSASSCSARGGDVASYTPEKDFETVAPDLSQSRGAGGSGASADAEVRLTPEQGAAILTERLSLDGDHTAEYRSTVQVYDPEYGVTLSYYLYDALKDGEKTGAYYVRVADDVREVFDAESFSQKFFDPNKKDYTYTKAGAVLLKHISGGDGMTADYLTTVTVTDMDYAGDMQYYKFDVKQNGAHIEVYYVIAEEYGCGIYSEEEFNEKRNQI